VKKEVVVKASNVLADAWTKCIDTEAYTFAQSI